ncbi:hypothetical protein vseg_018180 [Gypsophila vaccaria]
MFNLVKKLKQLKHPLKDLNRDKFSDIEKQTNEKEIHFKKLQEELGHNPSDSQLTHEEQRIRQDYSYLKEARDSYLRQKAKDNWSLVGDLNTAYFHGIIRGRIKRNKVIRINDMNGMECDNPIAVHNAFLRYYENLLGESRNTSQVHRKIMNYGNKCTKEMRSLLMEPVTGKEIKDTVFNIPVTKSPGPDGYTSTFYKDAWNVIGPDVIEAVKDFFLHKNLLKQINATSLVMIPKCSNPSSVQQYLPIACCNVIYKVISKILCDRLSRILPRLIDLNQGAFIKERSI